MTVGVAAHYTSGEDLAARIGEALAAAGKDLATLTTSDLASVDEFHIRGRMATLELAAEMGLTEESRVLDLGSGLGGPARTLAETHGCHVTGIDLTPAFCEAATEFSGWVGLAGKVDFRQGDACDLPFEDNAFDAALTIHVAMNIAAKDRLYSEARRVLKPGGAFAVYDVLQGEGGAVRFPTPWARDPALSHLATPEEMTDLLSAAGFEIVCRRDSTAESQAWFEAMTARMGTRDAPPVTLRSILGADFPEMARNQVRNLAERRIRTVSFLCRA